MAAIRDAASTWTCGKANQPCFSTAFLHGFWVITCGNYNGDGGTIVRSSLPPLGHQAGGTDVHSSDLYDWGQWHNHLHSGTGRTLSLAKTSNSGASPPESRGPRVERADYLTFVARRKMKCCRKPWCALVVVSALSIEHCQFQVLITFKWIFYLVALNFVNYFSNPSYCCQAYIYQWKSRFGFALISMLECMFDDESSS